MTMHPTGKHPRLIAAALSLVAALLLFAGTARAEVKLAVDRQAVAMGESFSLIISAGSAEELRQLDLRALETDFAILQRTQSSNTSIINGERSHSEQLSLELTPLREGRLEIPPLGGAAPIAIEVAEPVAGEERNDDVLFTAELDRETVYVQEQAILTLRIEQAVNLEARSLSELKLDRAFAVPLEQRSFQRTLDGRPWLVHEVRFAIFPERSGELQIPPQTFTARESRTRRSGINFGLGGRQLQRRSQPLTLQVEPRPAAFPQDATWLPARALSLEQSWSADPDTLQVGDSLTRNLSLRAEGLQGAQLPPIDFQAPEGLRYYTDQPQIEDSENPGGVVGLRQDSAALVASEPGDYTLPAIRVPWWDTTEDRVRYAEIPAQRITVLPGSIDASPPPAEPAAPGARSTASATPAAPPGPRSTPTHWLWPLLSAGLGLGWLLTALLWWRSHTRAANLPHSGSASGANNAGRAFRQLQAACTSHSPAPARRALLDWCQAQVGAGCERDLYTLAERLGDRELLAAIDELERALYAPVATPWHGDALLAAVRRLRQQPARQQAAPDLALYPGGE
ncbi:MAG: hypothetical protein CME38_08630 [Haliea sp.]|nr:hypothetical protein [Haliea sp.]